MTRREIHTTCSWLEAAQDDVAYNLVAVAFTPWHALSIDALILFLAERGVNVNAAIIITAHPKTGYALDESNFTNKCSTFYYDSMTFDGRSGSENASDATLPTGRIRFILDFYKNVFTRKRSLPPLYYVTNSFADMETVRRLHATLQKDIIITYSEEGVAAYMGMLRDPNQLKVRGLRDFKNYIRYQIFGNYVYRALHPSMSVKIFRKGLFGLRVNPAVLPYYKRAFSALNHERILYFNKSLVARSVIICTTAWDRTQIIDEEDLRVLKAACDYLHNRGTNIILKTHPRDHFWADKAQTLHAQLLDTGTSPMECICAEAQPLSIISFSSTILITAKVFWNIPTFCLSRMLDLSKIGAFYQDEMQHFEDTFKQHTCFVKSVEEIQFD